MKIIVKTILVLAPLMATKGYAVCVPGQTGYVKDLRTENGVTYFLFRDYPQNWIALSPNTSDQERRAMLVLLTFAKDAYFKVQTKTCDAASAGVNQIDMDTE
jgi:hypothetical protein